MYTWFVDREPSILKAEREPDESRGTHEWTKKKPTRESERGRKKESGSGAEGERADLVVGIESELL